MAKYQGYYILAERTRQFSVLISSVKKTKEENVKDHGRQNKMDNQGLLGKVTFKMRPKWKKGASHANFKKGR